MTAAASYAELPPVTTLALVCDDLAIALANVEQLVEEGRHDEAVEHLERSGIIDGEAMERLRLVVSSAISA